MDDSEQIASDIEEGITFAAAVDVLRRAYSPDTWVSLSPHVAEALIDGLRSVGGEKRRDDGGGGLQRPHA